MAAKKTKSGTNIEFIGGVNRDRIGGNCSIIEHTDEKGEVTRVMFDLGAMFAPYESGFDMALPNVEDYFNRINPETLEVIPARKPVSALFFTHAHEDHIGALIDYVKMGYELPPIYASRYTRAFIRLAFKQEGIEMPAIETIRPQQDIRIGKNVVVEPFIVSHSVVGSMGFHTLTFVNDEPYAGIINNGDFFTQENMPIGESFSFEGYQDLLKRKLVTHVLLDSTSTCPNGSERIGFSKAVENTLSVINNHRDRNIIVSPVISRSLQNIAIDIEIARRLGTKICLEGKWLVLAQQAMMLSGYKDFEDVLYQGKLDRYLRDKSIKTKYIVCTGAFAQGLKEYEFNQSDTSNIPMAAATKMALDLHKDLHINKDILVLARQRIIEEINGEQVAKMLQLFAAQGAVVVMSPSERQVGNIETVQMQDTGHITAKEMGQLMDVIREKAPEAFIIPIHGNPEQTKDTANIAIEHGLQTHITGNLQTLGLSKGKTSFQEQEGIFTWIGVKNVYYNPLNPDPTIPYEGIKEYWRINDWYMPIEKIGEAANVCVWRPGDKGYPRTRIFEKGTGGALFLPPKDIEDALLLPPRNKGLSKKERNCLKRGLDPEKVRVEKNNRRERRKTNRYLHSLTRRGGRKGGKDDR